MERVKIVLCGCGYRGRDLTEMLAQMEQYEVKAVCDTYEDKATDFALKLKEKYGVETKAYTDYEEMFEKEKPQAVVIAASWEMHVPIAIKAMEKGIAVALEVGGAYSEQDCWDLVNAYERTKTPLMFMENCCYFKDELFATNMARKGVFGKIVYCHGAYGHDLRGEVANGNKNRHYRLRNYINRNCDNYPTHELGPIAKLLNINRGNRMVSLVSMGSPACGLHDYVQGKEEYADLQDVTFQQSDIVETLIKCENGELISLRLDTTLPRFYAREFTVRGTKGLYMQEGNMVMEDGAFAHTLYTHKTYEKYVNNAEEYYEKYLPEMWKTITPEKIKMGHGGMDYLEFVEFADCLQNGKEMPIDVYDAAAWMSIAYLTEQSIKNGGAPVQIPDFTRGKYKTREPKDVIEF